MLLEKVRKGVTSQVIFELSLKSEKGPFTRRGAGQDPGRQSILWALALAIERKTHGQPVAMGELGLLRLSCFSEPNRG